MGAGNNPVCETIPLPPTVAEAQVVEAVVPPRVVGAPLEKAMPASAFHAMLMFISSLVLCILPNKVQFIFFASMVMMHLSWAYSRLVERVTYAQMKAFMSANLIVAAATIILDFSPLYAISFSAIGLHGIITTMYPDAIFFQVILNSIRHDVKKYLLSLLE